MGKSIITDNQACYLCGTTIGLEEHHCVFGRFRKLSDKYGLIVPLCRECHYDVHHNAETAGYLKKVAQRSFDQVHGDCEFIKVFGINFLDD